MNRKMSSSVTYPAADPLFVTRYHSLTFSIPERALKPCTPNLLFHISESCKIRFCAVQQVIVNSFTILD